MLKLLLREPLVHFLAFGLVIFGAHQFVNPAKQEVAERIVVTEAKIEQLAGLFAKTWQRPPTTDEIKGLIDEHVKEEIYYREALALGLDKNDTVIRRRLRQKLQFFSRSETELPAPTDAELQAYLTENAQRYTIEPLIAFSQVYFSSERRGANLETDIASSLDALRSRPDMSAASLGDATMLPDKVEMTRKAAIAQTFGPEFADGIERAPETVWTGPVISAFGQHLVRITEKKPDRAATLHEVRGAVARDWTDEKGKRLESQRLVELLKKYDVTIEEPFARAGETAGQQ